MLWKLSFSFSCVHLTMTTCAPAKTVQQNFSLTLSICKHSRQLDTRCRPCTPHSRRQIYVQKEPCVFAVRSRLRNVKSLQTLHQFWSGFELRCLLPPNASVSPHQKQSTRVHVKKRVREWARFCFLTLQNDEWWLLQAETVGTHGQRAPVDSWSHPAAEKAVVKYSSMLQDPTCVDRLATRALVPNSFFTCYVILLPKWTHSFCRCQSNGGGGGACLWDHMTCWIPTCVAVN